MINYYYSTHEDRALQEQPEKGSNDWTRVERPTDEEREILIKLGIDEDVLHDALDPHEVPRIEFDDGWTYYITRVPDIGDDFNDFTTPILFALGKGGMVTVSRDSLGRMWQPFIDRSAVPTTKTNQLFMYMVDTITQSYQNRVATINRQMRAVTSDIANLRPADIATFVEYERKLNDYLDALIATNNALEKMLGGKMLKLREEDREIVEDLSVDMEQVIARCKSLLRTITNVRDSYRAVMDTRLNETMRILTVATLSLTIPTMLAGLFGMNVEMPFDVRSNIAFWIIIAVSLLTAISVSTYFMRKR